MVFFKGMRRNRVILIMLGAILFIFQGFYSGAVSAKDSFADEIPPEVEVVNPYYTIERLTLDDGSVVEKNIIIGPREPLQEFEESRLDSIQPITTDGVIANFPSYDWVFGCSAVSGAMIAAYYDRNGYPDIYTGPTNGGVMPLSDALWGKWSDGFATYSNNPLIASRNGLDGRSIKGTIDDYWVKYDSTVSDPYITGGWVQHGWSNAIGDYMKTSQSAYGIRDGATVFFNSGSSRLTCDVMESATYNGMIVATMDGTYGRKQFYEARGYSVNDCYNEYTDTNGGGFTLSDYKAEIDAGHPVLMNLQGHSVVGYGYSGSTIYIRDTWSSNPSFTPTMHWNGTYQNMPLMSVSVVHLDPLTPPSPPTGVSATDGFFPDEVIISWNASSKATYYEVYRNTSNNHTGESLLSSSQTFTSYDDMSVNPDQTYYYWVKACNDQGCSDYSTADSGYADSEAIINQFYLPLIRK